MDATSDTPPRSADSASLDKLVGILWLGIAIGLVALILSNERNLIAAVGVGVLIFLSAFAGGCLLGFLFGVPRVLSREQNASAPPPGSGGATPSRVATAAPGSSELTAGRTAAGGGTPLLGSNTNLERISDWLTTLLVGAGLVQLYKINDALLMFRGFLASTARVFVETNGVHSAGALPAVGPVVLVFGIVCGFIYMYLNTRLVLIKLFFAIEGLLTRGEALPGSEQRAVKAIIRGQDNVGSFLQRQFSEKKTITVQDTLNSMMDILYKSDPERVIQLGAQLSNTAATNRPDYWYYLAAAFGQKLHSLEKDSPDWVSARDNALDCAGRAVALDGAYRDRLWSISDPSGPDNDMAPLRDDGAFRRLVGRPLPTRPGGAT